MWDIWNPGLNDGDFHEIFTYEQEIYMKSGMNRMRYVIVQRIRAISRRKEKGGLLIIGLRCQL